MEQTQTVGAVAEHSRCVVVATPQSVVTVPAVQVWPTFNAGIAVMGQQDNKTLCSLLTHTSLNRIKVFHLIILLATFFIYQSEIENKCPLFRVFEVI